MLYIIYFNPSLLRTGNVKTYHHAWSSSISVHRPVFFVIFDYNIEPVISENIKQTKYPPPSKQTYLLPLTWRFTDIMQHRSCPHSVRILWRHRWPVTSASGRTSWRHFRKSESHTAAGTETFPSALQLGGCVVVEEKLFVEHKSWQRGILNGQKLASDSPGGKCWQTAGRGSQQQRQPSHRSGLTMPLSRQSVEIDQETSSQATRQGTVGYSRLSSLSNCGLILA